jgi:hypothetical protein
MMTERSTPDDALLVRYIDGEASEDERAQVEAAAAADPAMAERLARLEQRTRALSDTLGKADIATPDSLRSYDATRTRRDAGPSRLLRAALFLGLAAAAAMMVPPVRAWVIDVLQRTPPRDEASAPAPALVTIDTVAIFFDAPPEFLIELEAAQRGGRLIVRIADVDQATAELRTPGGTESFFVVPEGLRIVNGDVSTAEYEIALPRSVREVRVRVPGSADVTYGTAGSERRVFELGR